MNKIFEIIDKLESVHSLDLEEYEYLIENRSIDSANYLKEKAIKLRKQI